MDSGFTIGGYDSSVVLLASVSVVLTLTTFCLFFSSKSGSKRPEQRNYKIKELFIYPVRGCGRMSVQAAKLDEVGLVNNGSWGIIDSLGKLLSQSDEPGLASVEPIISAEGGLVLRVPEGIPQLSVKSAAGDEKTIDIGGSTQEAASSQSKAVDCGDEAAAWLSKVLSGKGTYRLVKFKHGVSQIQIVNLASVDDVNRKMPEKAKNPVPASRFRPNVVVACDDAFAEDWWSNVNFVASFGWHAGKIVPLKVLGPVGRKIDVAVPQAGERIASGATEPFDTLKTFRATEPHFSKTPAFGVEVNLKSPAETCGAEVRVADSLEVSDWAREALPWAKNVQRALS